MLINNSFSTVDKNVPNSTEFVFGALQVNGFLGGQGIDESFWGGELLPLNLYLAFISSKNIKSQVALELNHNW